MAKSSLGKKRGIHTCNVCGVKFKRWCDAPILLICEDCYLITIPCEQCGEPARKYTKVARPRRFCDSLCRQTYIARKTAQTRGETTRQKHKTDQVYHEKMSAILRSVHHLSQTKENFEAISKSLKKRWKNKDYREYMSAMSRRIWEDRDKMLNSVKWHPTKMTNLERKIDEIISEWGITYHLNYMVGRYFIDFAFPEHMIGIECDGEYWHRNTREREAKRDAWLSSCGWTIIRLSENEIENCPVWTLATKVVPLIENCSNP